MNIWRTPTTSALSLSSEGLSRQFPVQYIGSGESQRLIGDIVLPYHDSFFVLSDEMESDFFDLVLIFAWSEVSGDDPDRRDTSIPKGMISLKIEERLNTTEYLLALRRTWIINYWPVPSFRIETVSTHLWCSEQNLSGVVPCWAMGYRPYCNENVWVLNDSQLWTKMDLEKKDLLKSEPERQESNIAWP